MARWVHEVMNRELFTLRPDEPADQAARFLLGFDVTSAPVQAERGLVGIASLRDLFGRTRGTTVADRMTAPVVTIRSDATIEDAARSMRRNCVRRLVVVDESGAPIGLVSALDVLSALIGQPVIHPATFPRYDATTGLAWSNDAPLTDEEIAKGAPAAPGILVLTKSLPGVCDEQVWAEAADDLRARLVELITSPQRDKPQLESLLERRDELVFRVARVDDPARRYQALESLRRRLRQEVASQAYFTG